MTISADTAFQLIENIYTGVLLFDRDLQLTAINTAAENLLSVSCRKALGAGARDILREAPSLVETLERALATGRPYTERGMELKLAKGQTTVDCIITPLHQDAGALSLILELIDVDAYVRVRREENLTVLHEAAQKSLHGMAHEIKNPLGGLRGAAQLLERELEGSNLREYTQIIISEADRLRNLIDRMLAPNGRCKREPVNIHEVLEYVQNLVQAEEGFSVQAARDYDPSLPVLQADREQLIQALLNVLRNASEAAGRDGRILLRTRIKRNCTVRQKHYKLAVQIEVIDNGPGVAPEIEQEIFYPMITTRAEGMGLGLSIAQTLVQSHGGSIDYERLADETSFRIILPLDECHE